jgi:hypothetical protein
LSQTGEASAKEKPRPRMSLAEALTKLKGRNDTNLDGVWSTEYCQKLQQQAVDEPLGLTHTPLLQPRRPVSDSFRFADTHPERGWWRSYGSASRPYPGGRAAHRSAKPLPSLSLSRPRRSPSRSAYTPRAPAR